MNKEGTEGFLNFSIIDMYTLLELFEQVHLYWINFSDTKSTNLQSILRRALWSTCRREAVPFTDTLVVLATFKG